MKNIFYGSFISGMQTPVAAIVKGRLPDVSILKLLDGAIIFETEASYDTLNFFCFNNIFAVIDIFATGKSSRSKAAKPLELHANRLLKYALSVQSGLKSTSRNPEDIFHPHRAKSVIAENNKKIQTFRLVCSMENKPASLDENLRHNIETFITRTSGLRPERRGGDTEFWLLYRSEGISFFMKRLTRSIEKRLRPGELSPQLAWLLCKLARLKSGETACDPFCGYGSIAEAALKYFPIKTLYAFDTNARALNTTGQRQSLKTERCIVKPLNVFELDTFLKPASCNAIITDPPWGMYSKTNLPLDQFYNEVLAIFERLLSEGGRAVILSAAKDELEAAVEKTKMLHITQSIPVLVAGKKASVFVVEKENQPL